MNEYMNFNKMITPMVIQVLFWILVAICVLAGVFQLGDNPIAGIATIILGPLMVRIYAELLLIMFQIHSRLNDIHTLLAEKHAPKVTEKAAV
jgi:hypothetical protein